MKLLVFGANGNVGSKVVKLALSRGHRVLAFVHGDSKLAPNKRLTILKGDIYDKDTVSKAVQQADAVISALGSWGTPNKDILTKGMEHIILAMERAGIRRIVSITGADARAKGDKNTFLHTLSRSILLLVNGKILIDGERHIELLEASNLDWTVVRSPIMNEKGKTGYKLTTNRPFPWQIVDRQAVAVALIDLIEARRATIRNIFIVGY